MKKYESLSLKRVGKLEFKGRLKVLLRMKACDYKGAGKYMIAREH